MRLQQMERYLVKNTDRSDLFLFPDFRSGPGKVMEIMNIIQTYRLCEKFTQRSDPLSTVKWDSIGRV